LVNLIWRWVDGERIGYFRDWEVVLESIVVKEEEEEEEVVDI
jgi:hypothetical protein